MHRSISPAAIFVFLTLFGANSILSAQTITEFPVINGRLGGLAAGPDGNVWFTEVVENKVGRITPAGDVTEFSINNPGAGPLFITAGPDGNLWFTEEGRQMIGRITTAGVITEFAIPFSGFDGTGVGIGAGPDGNVWFTERISRIGRISPQGGVVEFSINYDRPFAITAGPDGRMWFTVQAGAESKICSVTPEGLIRQYGSYGELDDPAGIVAGPDGNLWFTQATANRIGRITPQGLITQFPSPTPSASIAVGPDGNLWFTETGRPMLARMSTDGVVTGEFPLPSASSFPDVIVRGPDGNLWFTETSGVIGRLSFEVPAPAPRRRVVRR